MIKVPLQSYFSGTLLDLHTGCSAILENYRKVNPPK